MYKKFGKRFLDIVISLAALPFVLLATLFIAPIIKYCDHGPIFYIAPRLGYKGQTFNMFKFRSMVVNAPDIRLDDGSTFNGKDDSRQTKIGKLLRNTSLDELPQILNVLLGQMSLGGPKPDLPEHIKQFVGDELDKLNVRPGITGLNQAYYRNAIEWKERLKVDVQYSNSLSFLLDMKIILKTLFMIVGCKNVYSNNNVLQADTANYNPMESTKK